MFPGMQWSPRSVHRSFIFLHFSGIHTTSSEMLLDDLLSQNAASLCLHEEFLLEDQELYNIETSRLKDDAEKCSLLIIQSPLISDRGSTSQENQCRINLKDVGPTVCEVSIKHLQSLHNTTFQPCCSTYGRDILQITFCIYFVILQR